MIDTTVTKTNIKLSAPWTFFYREVQAFFGDDPEIRIEYDEETPAIKLYVENAEKAAALTELLPTEKVYGRIVLKITVIPANGGNETDASLIEKAFKGNPVFSYMSKGDNIISRDMTYIVFKNKVVQFFNDDLGDINGNCSTLYQNIASDVLGDKPGVFYCTDTEKNLGAPAGNWPPAK